MSYPKRPASDRATDSNWACLIYCGSELFFPLSWEDFQMCAFVWVSLPNCPLAVDVTLNMFYLVESVPLWGRGRRGERSLLNWAVVQPEYLGSLNALWQWVFLRQPGCRAGPGVCLSTGILSHGGTQQGWLLVPLSEVWYILTVGTQSSTWQEAQHRALYGICLNYFSQNTHIVRFIKVGTFPFLGIFFGKYS